ncbi:MAG: glycosyltransferase family 2 protein [Chloroflexota bacterium]
MLAEFGSPAIPNAFASQRRRAALVIPAWNEAGAIGAVLAEVPPDAVQWVFVVAGGSTDGTAEIARAYGAEVLGQARPGYGAACWAGAQAAAAVGAEIVAFLDGDYADPPADLPRVLAPLLEGRADLALGRRSASRHSQAVPLHARLGNRLVTDLLRLLLKRRLHDLPSFKAIRLDCLAALEMREMTYGWTTELIVKSIRAGLRIVEVPVSYRPRLAGSSKVSGTLRGSAGAAWKLCTCALRYARWRARDAKPTAPAAREVVG